MSEQGLALSKTKPNEPATPAPWLASLFSLSSLRESMLLLIVVAIWLFFYFATSGIFLTPRNLVLLALQTSIVSLAAISAVMLIVTRNFDLSVALQLTVRQVDLAVIALGARSEGVSDLDGLLDDGWVGVLRVDGSVAPVEPRLPVS